MSRKTFNGTLNNFWLHSVPTAAPQTGWWIAYPYPILLLTLKQQNSIPLKPDGANEKGSGSSRRPGNMCHKKPTKFKGSRVKVAITLSQSKAKRDEGLSLIKIEWTKTEHNKRRPTDRPSLRPSDWTGLSPRQRTHNKWYKTPLWYPVLHSNNVCTQIPYVVIRNVVIKLELYEKWCQNLIKYQKYEYANLVKKTLCWTRQTGCAVFDQYWLHTPPGMLYLLTGHHVKAFFKYARREEQQIKWP